MCGSRAPASSTRSAATSALTKASPRHRIDGMDSKALARHRKRLLELKAEILNEGDLPIEPGRTDPAAVGSDEDEQPLAEMSQTIASTRNRTRAAVLARVV